MRVREGQQKFLRLSFPEGQANLLSTGVWSVARGVVEGDKRTYPRARSPGGPLRLRLGVPEAQAQARTRYTRITRERERQTELRLALDASQRAVQKERETAR
jgi:hypothetical protein